MVIWFKRKTKILINLEKQTFYALIITMKIIDAHSHIDYITHDFQPDVVGTVCCAAKQSEWGVLANMMKSDNRIYGAFGIHPWFIDESDNKFESELIDLLKNNHNFMVGEIGLDKYKPNMETQINVFKKQLNIAIRFNRTVFLHCVGAWDKFLHILKQYKQSELPIIVAHDFNGNENILNELLKFNNVYFSLGKNVLYGRFCRIEQIPLNKILIETDGNKDIILKDLINKISDIKNESDMDDIIYNNTLKVLSNG